MHLLRIVRDASAMKDRATRTLHPRATPAVCQLLAFLSKLSNSNRNPRHRHPRAQQGAPSFPKNPLHALDCGGHHHALRALSTLPRRARQLRCHLRGLPRRVNKQSCSPSRTCRHWWQYLIVVGLLFLSFLFCYAGKVESVIFDKETNHFSLCKTSILCRSNARIF